MTVLVILFLFVSSSANFLEIPTNVSSIIGGSVTFRCSSDKPVVYSQWKSNTGSLLGYHQEGLLPGHQGRYSYIKRNPGQLYLKINRVNLNDDGEYECQMLHPVDGPVRAKSFLDVIVLPQSIYFLNYQQGAAISVKETNVLNLTCVIPNVKPEPEIMWYIGGKLVTNQFEKTSHQHVNKTFTIFTSLSLDIDRADHGKTVSCQVIQREHNVKMMSNISLDVLYPNSEPIVSILGFPNLVRSGDNVSLDCSVKGGNPLPDVSWFSNDQKMNSHSILETKTKETKNIYSFIVSKTNNWEEFKCKANNSQNEFLSKSIIIEMSYPPEDVELFGDSYVRYGKVAHFQCKSQVANPAPQLIWSLNGKPMKTSIQKEITMKNGFVSISNISLNLADFYPDSQQYTIRCEAKNSEGIASKQVVVKVIAPPNAPEIQQLNKKLYFEGEHVNISCIARGGNPLADLTWFRGNEKIFDARYTVYETFSLSTLYLRVDRRFNNHRLKCEAMNAALDDPLADSRQMNVAYSPRQLVIKNAVSRFIAGKPARLVCESLASNPAADLTWRFSSTPTEIVSGDISLNESSKFDGFNVENVLSFLPSDEHDGSLVYCIANNSDWQQSVNTSLKLSVLYPPKLLINNPVTIVVSENDSFKENLTIRSNPPVENWSWRKNENFFDHKIGNVFARGAVFFGKKIENTDSGVYTVTATNSIGSTNLTIKLIVEYSPKITKISTPVIAALDDTVFLECEADGEPSKPKMTKWFRNGKQIPCTYRSNNIAVLRLNATTVTAGEYTCIASNGIGLPAEKKTFLLVNSAPTMHLDPKYVKSAAMIGETALLVCRAQAVPVADFVWKIGEQIIKSNSSKYSFAIAQIDFSTFESKLWIKNVTPDDYNNHILCTCQNKFGSDSVIIPLIPPTYPDQPQNLIMTNSTMDTISIAWKPQFDGGSEQIFEVKYKLDEDNKFHKVNTSYASLRLSGLAAANTYSFQIRSMNARGFSSQWSDTVLFSTLSENGMMMPIRKNKAWLTTFISIVLTVAVLFILFHATLCCFCCNRKKKKLREKTEQVRLAIEDVRRVQMYGAISTHKIMTHHDFREMPDISEDEHSVRTMIEVSPNGYMQPLDNIFYESAVSQEYDFQLRSNIEKNDYEQRTTSYANVPYPEPPRPNSNHQSAEQLLNNNLITRNHLSTFINSGSRVHAGPIDFAQLDGDLV